MKIAFSEAVEDIRAQASFRSRHGLGEFSVIFFCESDNLSFSWGYEEGNYFNLTVWRAVGKDGDDVVLNIRFEVETPDERDYIKGEIFTRDDKDSTHFLFVPIHTRESLKLEEASFTYARVNMEDLENAPAN